MRGRRTWQVGQLTGERGEWKQNRPAAPPGTTGRPRRGRPTEITRSQRNLPGDCGGGKQKSDPAHLAARQAGQRLLGAGMVSTVKRGSRPCKEKPASSRDVSSLNHALSVFGKDGGMKFDRLVSLAGWCRDYRVESRLTVKYQRQDGGSYSSSSGRFMAVSLPLCLRPPSICSIVSCLRRPTPTRRLGIGRRLLELRA